MSKFSKILASYGDTSAESAGQRKKTAGCTTMVNVLKVPLARLVRDDNQPRKEFDVEELHRLAGSLKSKGQLQPIVARYDEQADKFVIVAGERRWRAAELAGLPTLDVVLDERERDMAETLEAQLAENLVRCDLPPIEQANAYKQLMERRGWNAGQLSDALNISTSVVSRALALLDLPDEIKAQVNAGEIKGEALRQITRRKPAKGKRKAKTLARTFNVQGAKIVVTFKRADVSPAEIAQALRAAADLLDTKGKAAA